MPSPANTNLLLNLGANNAAPRAMNKMAEGQSALFGVAFSSQIKVREQAASQAAIAPKASSPTPPAAAKAAEVPANKPATAAVAPAAPAAPAEANQTDAQPSTATTAQQPATAATQATNSTAAETSALGVDLPVDVLTPLVDVPATTTSLSALPSAADITVPLPDPSSPAAKLAAALRSNKLPVADVAVPLRNPLDPTPALAILPAELAALPTIAMTSEIAKMDDDLPVVNTGNTPTTDPSLLVALVAPMPLVTTPQVAVAVAEEPDSLNEPKQSLPLLSALPDPSDAPSEQVKGAVVAALGEKGAQNPLSAASLVTPATASFAATVAAVSAGSVNENAIVQANPAVIQPPIQIVGRPAEGKYGVVDASKSMFAVHVPVSAEGWDRAIGQKVVMMVSNQRQEVEMQLNPPHLGPIEVKLSMSQGEASLSFVSAHAQVREALQASMPRLQEMMADSGIQLNRADVSAGNSQQRGDQRDAATTWRNPARANDKLGDEEPLLAPRQAMWMSAAPGGLNLFV